MTSIASTPTMVQKTYQNMETALQVLRRRLNRPLTLAEKVLLGHLANPEEQDLLPGKAYLYCRPDRVILQDATAQMALLQFLLAGRKRSAVPTTVHCDHLIRAQVGAEEDLAMANDENAEVYDFLKTVSRKYGLGFFKPGAGIIHQVALEQLAFPGCMILGTDSHTPNAGGMGSLAIGVGGADAVDVMLDRPWEVLQPRLIGVRLTGKPSGWTAPKDVILKVLDILTVKGGTNAIVEYFGPGVETLSLTGRSTITNMGAELGATTSIFPYDTRTSTYLQSTERTEVDALAQKYSKILQADPEVTENPETYFHRVIEIDLSTLEPHVVGPHTPDRARQVSEWGAEVAEEKWPTHISAGLIGSCTNSSYEDISRAAALARQASAKGFKSQIPLYISPGSESVRATIERDHLLEDLEKVGAIVLANACGPCIGQWRRSEEATTHPNAILTSFNRNFPKRNDGSPNTLAFISSPEVVMAYALTGGDLLQNPLENLDPPPQTPEVPPEGFVMDEHGYVPPADNPDEIDISVSPQSNRLALLQPFSPWDGQDFTSLPLLLKAKGKCTTDHISQAGPWLKFRGHLDKISDNLFLGAVNAFSGEVGKGENPFTKEIQSFPALARDLKARNLSWCVVGDENYGEGSSREHAAMEPRHLGCAFVLVRSFARIHETNLKKQGVLPLTFVNPKDYESIQKGDRLDVKGLSNLAPGQPLTVSAHHQDQSQHEFQAAHTLNEEQISWFKVGSALNDIRSNNSSPN